MQLHGDKEQMGWCLGFLRHQAHCDTTRVARSLSGWSPETLLPHGTRGTGTQLAHAERQGCSFLFSGYSGAVSQGPHGGSIRVLFAL